MGTKAWNSFINNQSVKARFLTTLFVNIARIGLGFLSGVIIARTLGPADYGNYSFLLGSFGSITVLLDMGTSEAFYTFLSQRKRSQKFYVYYLLWIGIQFITVLSLISFIFPDTWRDTIWMGHTKWIIILAFVASFMMNKVWQVVTQAGESIRATATVQLHNIVISVLYLCIILTMGLLYRLTVVNLFIIATFTYFLLSFILARRLKDRLIAEDEGLRLRGVIDEFKSYCAPLIIYSVISFLYSFADMWLLQRFGGAVQQGFYSIGLRFSSICLIATTSMLSVFWKEIADASESGNKERLYYLYIKISRGLYFIGAVGVCFLIPFSREILVFLLGEKYEMGWPCVTIMFLFPAHQALGQINGTYFYATAQTRLYSKIGIIMMILSIPITYFVLASRSSIVPGLDLGSLGMALKIVVLQIIGVNLYIYFISRLSQWKFDFLYQFTSIGVLLVTSFAIKMSLVSIFNIANISFHPMGSMILCIPIYILATGLIIYLFPSVSGLERKQVTNSIQFIHGFFKKIRGF